VSEQPRQTGKHASSSDASNSLLSSATGLKERLLDLAEKLESVFAHKDAHGTCCVCDAIQFHVVTELKKLGREAAAALPEPHRLQPIPEASRDSPEAMVHLRHQLATLLDNLYGLHFRPGHLDAILRVASADKQKCLLDPDLAVCVTHDNPLDWVECTGWRCDVSGEIVKDTVPSLSVEEKKEP
jgi:hypothetical protein